MPKIKDLIYIAQHWPDMARSQALIWKEMNRRLSEVGFDVRYRKVLDIACGNLYQQSFLYHCNGVDVVGSDLWHIRHRDIGWNVFFRKIIKKNRMQSMLKLAFDIFTWYRYYRIMLKHACTKEYIAATKLVTTDATSMGFKMKVLIL